VRMLLVYVGKGFEFEIGVARRRRRD